MNFNIFSLCLLSQILWLDFGRSSFLEHDGVLNVKIEHSLSFDPITDLPIFTERGNISVQSIKSGQTVINQNELTPSESQQLKELALNNKFYQIRTTIDGRGNNGDVFISTVKACMLAEAELDDRILISLDYAGKVVAVSEIIASKSTCEGASVSVDKLKYFTSNVYVKYTEMGPVPDTATYIQKLDREREAKERGETKDNRSFFAKYWMYFVPVIIIMLISSASNTENAGQGAAS